MSDETTAMGSARAPASEGPTGHRGSWPSCLISKVGRLVLSGGSLRSSPLGPLESVRPLSTLTTWKPASLRAGHPKERGRSCTDSYDLGSEVTHHHFCCISCSRKPTLVHHERGQYEGANIRNRDSLEAALKAADHMRRGLHREK